MKWGRLSWTRARERYEWYKRNEICTHPEMFFFYLFCQNNKIWFRLTDEPPEPIVCHSNAGSFYFSILLLLPFSVDDFRYLFALTWIVVIFNLIKWKTNLYSFRPEQWENIASHSNYCFLLEYRNAQNVPCVTQLSALSGCSTIFVTTTTPLSHPSIRNVHFLCVCTHLTITRYKSDTPYFR